MLDELERRATAGADVVHPVGEPELTERRGAVPAADDGEAPTVGDGLGDGTRPGREGLELGDLPGLEALRNARR